MQLKARSFLKSGNSEYGLVEKKILKKYGIDGQICNRKLTYHRDGFSIRYSLCNESILEMDVKKIKEIIKLNPGINKLPPLYKAFNPDGKDKEYFQKRMKKALEFMKNENENKKND